METQVKPPYVKQQFSFTGLPEINFTHINNLTDDTGIIQHALFNIPNRKEGYCIDDNARALLLSVLACRYDGNIIMRHRLLHIYLSFIHYMQTEDGEFKNFMSYAKATSEERGSEDSFGRTMMALGYLVNESPSKMLSKTAAGIFSRAYSHIEKLTSLRGIANTVIGLCHYIKYNYPDDIKKNLVIQLSDKIVSMYRMNSSQDNWNWFEPILTYDNGIPPLALLHAYEITGEERYRDIAFESMVFLESKVFHDDILSPIGNNGWCHQNSPEHAMFDQQGIDATAMVLYYQQAYRLTRNEKYLERMYTCHHWFLGKNVLGLSLYDTSNGGCADGLNSKEINLNQGAESTLAYWISHLIVASELKL